MNDHDLIEETRTGDEVTVRCACGLTFTALTRRRAVERHQGHFGVMAARAALDAHAKGDKR